MTEQPVTGPLAGLRVVELAGIGPAPFCAMLLADLGADVVRVDRAGAPPPLLGDPAKDLLNRGKRSIAVDLKHELGPELVLRLAERADVLLEGYRPGVAERLGVGPEPCLARNPRLVYGRMTGWGQEGPLAQTAGHDIALPRAHRHAARHRPGRRAAAGAAEPGRRLRRRVPVPGGRACWRRCARWQRSGRGQVVDAAIVDGAAHLATMIHGMLGRRAVAGPPRREPPRHRRAVLRRLRDVGRPARRRRPAGAPVLRRARPAVLGLAGTAPAAVRRRGLAAAARAAARAFATRTRDEWEAVFEGTDACVAPVLSLREAHAHPHLAARGTFVEHHGVTQPAPAPRFSATPAALTTPPARPGRAHEGRPDRLGPRRPGRDRGLGSRPVSAHAGAATGAGGRANIEQSDELAAALGAPDRGAGPGARPPGDLPDLGGVRVPVGLPAGAGAGAVPHVLRAEHLGAARRHRRVPRPAAAAVRRHRAADGRADRPRVRLRARQARRCGSSTACTGATRSRTTTCVTCCRRSSTSRSTGSTGSAGGR